MTIIAAAKRSSNSQSHSGLQIVEVKRIFHSPEEEQALKSQYSLQAEQSTEQLRKYETMLQQLQELFILTRSSGKGLKIKRKVYTLEELEQTFDENITKLFDGIKEYSRIFETNSNGSSGLAEEELLGRGNIWMFYRTNNS